MTADQLKILNGAVLADDGREAHHALNARLLGQRRIRRRHFLIRLAACTLPPTRMRSGVTGFGASTGGGGGGGGAAPTESAETTQTAGNAAGDAADHAATPWAGGRSSSE